MRAAAIIGSKIDILTLPDPVPGPGRLLVKPLLTGICGSDLSLRKQMAELEAATPEDQRAAMIPVIVPGHEFSGEIIEIPKGMSTDFKVGELITALPFTHDHDGMQTIGLSPVYSGGIATLSCVDAERSFRIPDGITPDLAALTEPLSVGYHAANLATRSSGPCVVIGCGPVGLAVILALKLSGRGPVMAADFSSERRKMAEALGADIVLNPAETSPYEAWTDFAGQLYSSSPLLEREFKGRPPGLNIFECTGVSGVLSQVVNSAPPHAHIVVAGVCPHEETITPLEGILRELTLEFSFAYRPEEFAAALRMIADHPKKVSRLITSQRPLAETEQAFNDLAKHPSEIKVLISPQD